MHLLAPISAEQLAEAIGLPDDGTGLPTRAAVARATRSYVGVKRAAHYDELAAWFEALASAAGYAAKATEGRFWSVCRQLTAAGDVALVESGGIRYLLAVEPTTVKVGPEHDVLLGDIDETEGVAGAHSVVRRIPAQEQSVDLVAHIPPPPWASIADSLGLSEGTSPARILTSLREAVSRLSLVSEPGCEPETLVELGGTNIRLCNATDDNGATPMVHFIDGTGKTVCQRLVDADHLAWLYLAHAGPDCTKGWPDQLDMPEALLAILTLIGTPEDDGLQRWTLDETATEIFLNWTGLPKPQAIAAHLDQAQAAVIEAPIEARLLVTAGPGSGKTWAACSRIARLIEAGAVPSRILVLSFTRAAVGEIRDRIAGFLTQPADAFEINIHTLDSFAWALNSGAGTTGIRSSADYEAGIKQALRLLEAEEDWLLDELERYQHVLIDEAQDLTGDRRSLILALLGRLDRGCGISVFHDPAQSIYHFLKDERAGIGSGLTDMDPAFSTVQMLRNYRCSSRKLQDLFAAGRRILESEDLDPSEIYERIRAEIEKAAEPENGREGRISGRDTFHLFRWRGQLTSAIGKALREGRPVRTRLPHHRTLIQPWISAALQSVIGGTISKDEFHEAYTSLRPFPGKPVHQAWEALRRVAGEDGGGVNLLRLAEVMNSGAPLAELAIADIGPRSAPLLSTVHAAKGREAEGVVLSLPDTPGTEEPEKILEEARVLFVGATRASKELRIEASSSWMRTLSGPRTRNWRVWTGASRPAAQVEIGLPADIVTEAPENGGHDLTDANFHLWRRSEKVSKAMLTQKGGRYQISFDKEFGGVQIGWLSAEFEADLRAIGKELTGRRVNPSNRIEGVFVVGASSVVSGDLMGSPRFTLAPILAGTPLVFFH